MIELVVQVITWKMLLHFMGNCHYDKEVQIEVNVSVNSREEAETTWSFLPLFYVNSAITSVSPVNDFIRNNT